MSLAKGWAAFYQSAVNEAPWLAQYFDQPGCSINREPILHIVPCRSMVWWQTDDAGACFSLWSLHFRRCLLSLGKKV